MTSKHQSPEWRRTCRVIRQQVRAAWARGDDVNCWRHGDPLPEGTPFDVGHLDPYGGESLANAAPECRRGNRSHGGKLGARIRNARRQAGTKPTVSNTTTEMVTPPWM